MLGSRSTPLLVLALITLATGALDSWSAPQSQPKTLHNLMVSIDESLLTLVNSKWDSNLREMEHRLESLETTFRRLDSTLQERLDKLERNLNSKELKDELMVEKLSHKMRDILDTSYDRYSRRLGYAEERLEMSLKKVQMSSESILNRMEKQQEDIQTDVTETVSMMEDLKSYYTTTDDRLNSTHKAIHQQIQSLVTPNRDELQRISGSLEHISTRLNNSVGMWGSQNDGPQTADVLSAIRLEINSESSKITSKVNNMYNEMWRRVVSVESLLKDLGRLSNKTRQEVLEEVRSLVPSERDFPGESQENFLEVALDAIERKLQKLSRNVDERMDTLTARQDLVMDSCFEGGMCRGLEARLSQVLERIFDIFSIKIENSTNKTQNLDSLVMKMMDLVKLQHSHLIRTVAHNTNKVVTLADENSYANKLLQYNITQLSNHFQEIHAELGSWKFCTGNKSITDLDRSSQLPSKIATEVKLTTFNVTEQQTDIPKQHYDVGVLKITTDNFEILADNSSLSNDSTPHVMDNSILQIVASISPNLTSDQMESLLRVLNSSVSFDGLEAIIQNTEAEPTLDEGSTELLDDEHLNTTLSEDTVIFGDTALSNEKENLSENNEDIQDQEADNTANSTIVSNVTIFTDTGINENVTNKTEPYTELTTELKEELKVYTFIWKIKYGYINMTFLRQQLGNESSSETIQLLSTLQRLCYDQDKQENNVIRNRLLLTDQADSNTELYEEIENICNITTEYIPRHNKNKGSNLEK